LVGLLATCVAWGLFLSGFRRTTLVGSVTVLAALMLLNSANYLVNFIEWAGVRAPIDLDVVEDTLDLLSPLVWWFFLYSCCHFVVSQKLRQGLAEKQRMEQAIRESESRLRTVVENVPVHIFNVDREGKILFANGEFKGIPAERAVGAKFKMFVPPEADELVEAAVKRVFEDGEPQFFELVEPKAGDPAGVGTSYSCRLAPVQSNGTIVSAICVATDFTELKQAEQELRDSEQRFRTLVEHAPEAIFVLDVDEDRMVDFNENALQLFKLRREEMLERSLLDLSPPLQGDSRASAEVAQQLIEEALDGKTPVVDWLHRDAEGNTFACEMRLARLPSARRRLVRGSVTQARLC
jgi:PAS domain S-box-containing protein